MDYFKAAAEFLEGKKVVTKEEFRTLSKKARAQAFTVSGYSSLKVLEEFLNKLTEAVKEGTTKEQFQEKMNDFLKDGGYDPVNPWKADNIFRTNLQTAYNAGHYMSMTEPEVLAARPFWQYKTAGDGKERPSHALMADRVYPADHRIWDVWYPPNGYKCRCTVVTLSKSQVEKRGLHVWDSLPSNPEVVGRTELVYPDKGFSGNPAKQRWRPDLSHVPPALKKVYQNRTRQKPR